jgi:transcriptional regulator with XRE-family HTH domain
VLKIRYWRKKRGLALKALQAKTGIPYQTLSNYERGTADPPTERLVTIAEALEIPVGALFPRRRKGQRPAGFGRRPHLTRQRPTPHEEVMPCQG